MNSTNILTTVLSGAIRWLWVLLVLFWTPIKWVLSIDVFFQGIRAIYYWDDPTVFAGWTFLAHFAALTALTYFVAEYRPKGL